MQIFFELRYPTHWYTKLLTALLALVFFAVLATLAISGFLVYRIVKPQRTSTEISMASFPGRPETVPFTVSGVGAREGWFFPGLRGAPTIILCHGYESSRGELLTLISALQDHQYNVFAFDFTAHGANAGLTTLGYREAGEVHAALEAVAARADVDATQFGIWGYNIGAYAALREAESDKRVRALILDSVYDDPTQMVRVGVQRNGLGSFPLMITSAETSFRWLNRDYRNEPGLASRLKNLNGVAILFIKAVDDPELGAITHQMFWKALEPREEVTIPHGNFVRLSDEEKRAYENRVVSFFLGRLSPVGGPVF